MSPSFGAAGMMARGEIGWVIVARADPNEQGHVIPYDRAAEPE